jgi:hypothetical protein
MSADNGVFILETSTPQGPEYRVIYAQGIDNIYGKFNDRTLRWEGDMNMMVDYFRDSDIFSTYAKALDYAKRLSQEHTYLEYGICFIDDFKEQYFGA